MPGPSKAGLIRGNRLVYKDNFCFNFLAYIFTTIKTYTNILLLFYSYSNFNLVKFMIKLVEHKIK